MNISIDAIRGSNYAKNKAIVPVHLFGRAANMERLWLAKSITYMLSRDNASHWS
jgi:dTDP-4-amino-4,6-dideoxygalactose transaminase